MALIRILLDSVERGDTEMIKPVFDLVCRLSNKKSIPARLYNIEVHITLSLNICYSVAAVLRPSNGIHGN